MSDLRAAPTKPLSDQERLELADKLDRELDEFIESLPKRKQEDPIPFDRWEEVRLCRLKCVFGNPLAVPGTQQPPLFYERGPRRGLTYAPSLRRPPETQIRP